MPVINQNATVYYPLTEWAELYADYINNFLTVERFAEYYGLSSSQADDIINVGCATDNYSKNTMGLL